MSGREQPLALDRHRRAIELTRDTEPTAFTVLLSELLTRIPGASAAALVDRDGESVDYAGNLSPFDVKVAAAHWQIVLGELQRTEPFVGTRQVVVRGTLKSFIVRTLAEGYSVVVVLSARAGFAASTRAFLVFERAILREAGIGASPNGPKWTPVTVENDVRARPRALAATASAPRLSLEVLGAVVGLGKGEKGFRIRLDSGFEATVVREPGGAWYADEPIDRSGKAAK